MNKQTAIAKRFMLKKKREKWHEFCDGLNYQVPISRVWKFFKTMNGRPDFDFNYPIKSQQDLLIHKDSELANVFADYYTEVFNKDQSVLDSERKKLELQVAIQISFAADYNTDFQLHELKVAIESLKVNSAMGADLIHNRFLYNFPTTLLDDLLSAINQSWRNANLPSQLKLSTLIPIVKVGKDASLVESYRPISLLSCLSKLIEKLVYSRLYTFVENKNCLPIFQCGFRKNHSCLDVLTYLEHHIQLSLRTKKVLV